MKFMSKRLYWGLGVGLLVLMVLGGILFGWVSSPQTSLSKTLNARVRTINLIRQLQDYNGIINDNGLWIFPARIDLGGNKSCRVNLLVGGNYQGKQINFLINEDPASARYVQDIDQFRQRMQFSSAGEFEADVLLGKPKIADGVVLPDINYRQGYFQYAGDHRQALKIVDRLLAIEDLNIHLPFTCQVLSGVYLPVISIGIE